MKSEIVVPSDKRKNVSPFPNTTTMFFIRKTFDRIDISNGPSGWITSISTFYGDTQIPLFFGPEKIDQ